MVRVKTVKNKDDIRKPKKKTTSTSNRQTPEYKAYQKYLKSETFKALREKMLERDGYRCVFCGRDAEEAKQAHSSLQAHHRRYLYLGCGDERELADLVTVCGICHRSAHSAKSNLRRFTDKTPILNNLKNN